jgi:hypothetical protein
LIPDASQAWSTGIRSENRGIGTDSSVSTLGNNENNSNSPGVWYAKLKSDADWDAFQEEARRLLAALGDSASSPACSSSDDDSSPSSTQQLSPDEVLALLIQREEEIFWSKKKRYSSAAATAIAVPFFSQNFSWTASTVTAAVLPLLAFTLLNNRR